MDFELYNGKCLDMHRRMRADGVDIGSLVELALKDKVVLNLETTTVPTYHGELEGVECEKPAKRTCVGYVCGFDEKKVGLVPVWDHDKKRNAAMGYIGGVNIDNAAIEAYKIISK